MSAAVKPEKYEKVILAASQHMEAQEQEIARLEQGTRALQAQNRRLAEEKLNMELRLSQQILSIHATYLDRITALEGRCTDLEKHCDRIANTVQGLMGGPDADAWQRIRESVDGLLARENV